MHGPSVRPAHSCACAPLAVAAAAITCLCSTMDGLVGRCQQISRANCFMREPFVLSRSEVCRCAGTCLHSCVGLAVQAACWCAPTRYPRGVGWLEALCCWRPCPVLHAPAWQDTAGRSPANADAPCRLGTTGAWITARHVACLFSCSESIGSSYCGYYTLHF